ncbi:MAG: type II CAAX prenyl endopeptidase Rce1 family protein [Candidatus Anstonellales archaeon]
MWVLRKEIIFRVGIALLSFLIFIYAFFNPPPLNAYYLHSALLLFSFAVLFKKMREVVLPKDIFVLLRETVFCLFAIVFLGGLVSLLAYFLGVNDVYKVAEKVEGFGVFLMFIAVFFVPLSEELFFRAFLTEKIGIILSALVFGLAHFSYGSVVEILGAFVIGLVFGYFYVRNKSVSQNILAHVIFNVCSIALTKIFY